MADGAFSYVAVDPSGRKVRGSLVARDDSAAFEQLRRDGLSPVSLKSGAVRQRKEAKAQSLGKRESADFLSSLADLLNAGADIRTALGILAARFERPAVRRVCQGLANDIGGGESLERAFARGFPGAQAFVASMVAAGEAAGDLPGGLQRAADVLTSRLQLRNQLVSVLAYPSFVLASAIGAVFVILLFIVPSIAPLAQDSGATPPMSLAILIAASDFLRQNLLTLAAGFGASIVVLMIAISIGALNKPLEALSLDGPVRRTVRGVVFGSFAISLGTMLSAGAPISDALRLAVRAVPSRAARRRLEPLSHAVRQGQQLSTSLDTVKGFPPAIIRLAAVGEASNTLGKLLMRGGRLEEEAALRRIETLGRVAGPALIVLLGAMLGILMGGLLSGVSQMGQSVLE